MRSSAASRAPGVEGANPCLAVHPLPPSFSFLSFLITLFYDGHEKQSRRYAQSGPCVSVSACRQESACRLPLLNHSPRPHPAVHTDRPWSLDGELSQLVLQLAWGIELLSSAYPETPGTCLCLHMTLNSPRGGKKANRVEQQQGLPGCQECAAKLQIPS